MLGVIQVSTGPLWITASLKDKELISLKKPQELQLIAFSSVIINPY